MGPVDILNKIIEKEGNCCGWASKRTCASCPLGEFKHPNGNYMSCIEAVGIEGLTEEQQDAKYKAVATKLLMDMQIDKMLEEHDGVK